MCHCCYAVLCSSLLAVAHWRNSGAVLCLLFVDKFHSPFYAHMHLCATHIHTCKISHHWACMLCSWLWLCLYCSSKRSSTLLLRSHFTTQSFNVYLNFFVFIYYMEFTATISAYLTALICCIIPAMKFEILTFTVGLLSFLAFSVHMTACKWVASVFLMRT